MSSLRFSPRRTVTGTTLPHWHGRSLVLIALVLLGLAPTWSWQASDSTSQVAPSRTVPSLSLAFALPVSERPLDSDTGVKAQVPTTHQASSGSKPTQTQSPPPRSSSPVYSLLDSIWSELDLKTMASMIMHEKAKLTCQKLWSLNRQRTIGSQPAGSSSDVLPGSVNASNEFDVTTRYGLGYGWSLDCKQGAFVRIIFEPLGSMMTVLTPCAVKDFRGGITGSYTSDRCK